MSQDFSNLYFVGKRGQKFKYLKNHNFRTTQVINIKLVSLKSDKQDLCKYIRSDGQLLIFKITLNYLVIYWVTWLQYCFIIIVLKAKK